MKKLLLLACLLFILVASALAADKKPYYNIEVKIKGMKDTMVYLANYFGDNTYLVDSAMMNSKGVVVFKRDTILECGVYMIAVNRTKLFEFVVFENDFSLETEGEDYVGNMKVKGSKQNDWFYEFQKYTQDVGMEDAKLRGVLAQWQADPARQDTVAKINARLKQIPSDVYNFRVNFMQRYPDAVLTKIFMAMKEVEVPEIKDATGKLDSAAQFDYYRTHFWDNVDFASGCVLRSPVYHSKLQRYMERLTVQHPDSLCEAAYIIVDKAKAHPEMFRYTLQWIMNTYEKSPYICMDAVPVRLAMKYYTYKDCYWLDSTAIYRTRANAESFLPTLCNLYAPELKMHDSTLERKIVKIVESDSNEESRAIKLGVLLSKEKTVDLYDVKANYTIVVFWDPDCGHCKKEMPVIKEMYEKVKNKGVQVYAVGVEPNLDNWAKYVRENKLTWINVIDSYNISQFRKYYNINSTPQIFLLDKDKRIMAKRLSAEQLKKLVYDELGMEYVAPPESHSKDDGHGH